MKKIKSLEKSQYFEGAYNLDGNKLAEDRNETTLIHNIALAQMFIKKTKANTQDKK